MYYYRVETMNVDTGITVGGYVSASLAITYKALGLKPGSSAEELCAALALTSNENALAIYRQMAVLGGVAQPEVYVNDRPNHYCLYTADGLWAATPSLKKVDKAIRSESKGLYYLICRRITIPDNSILYEDEDQIVITKEDYDRYCDKEAFYKMTEWEDDWSELGA